MEYTETLCPICSNEVKQWCKHLDIRNVEVVLLKCLVCGHGFYNKNYSDGDLNEIYNNDYSLDYLDTTEGHALRVKQYSLDVEVLSNYLSGSKRVLDIGCSSGEFLDSMPSNWSKFAFETNKTYLKHLVENRPNYTLIKSLDHRKLQHLDNFDAITLRGVIEHIPNHTELISLIIEKLNVSGILYVCATPDFSSPCAVVYGSQWGQIVCPEHIHQFTPASIQILLARAGLVLKDLRHGYLETPYQNFNQDSIKFLENFARFQRKEILKEELQKHAFPGNMMTAVFQKVAS